MSANTDSPRGELDGNPDAAIRQLYSHYAPTRLALFRGFLVGMPKERV